MAKPLFVILFCLPSIILFLDPQVLPKKNYEKNRIILFTFSLLIKITKFTINIDDKISEADFLIFPVQLIVKGIFEKMKNTELQSELVLGPTTFDEILGWLCEKYLLKKLWEFCFWRKKLIKFDLIFEKQRAW